VRLVPELGRLTRPFEFRLSDWVAGDAGGVVLWVDARVLWGAVPARCVSLRLEPHEGGLAAAVPERFGARVGARDAWTYTLRLGHAADLLGPGRVRRGGSIEAVGGLHVLGGSLGGAGRDVLRYDGVRFEPTITCRVRDVAGDPRCPPCRRCVGFVVGERRLETVPFPQELQAPEIMTSAYDPRQPPRCGPCPPDTLRLHLPRLQRAMVGQVFVHVFNSGPAFFRRQADCQADLRRRRPPPEP
jgi:hypothetical protein